MEQKKYRLPNREGRMEQLVKEVDEAAYKTMNKLWGAILEVAEPDILRAVDKALRLMTSHKDCAGAMKLLESMYALTQIAPSEDFVTCQEYAPLSQMFMERFLLESEIYIFDIDISDVLKIVNGDE